MTPPCATIARRPVTLEQFSSTLQKLGLDEAHPQIAVAVSGGGDSLALALLMQEWIKARAGRMLALTVDHGLRPEAAAEALAVQALFGHHGIEHRILHWAGEKPATHIQERARAARYKLLSTACHAEGISVLAVAHNREDQIETFWMRLAHGSGLDGLAAMARDHEYQGLHIIRPLLEFSREELRDTCHHYGVDWIEDPSNRQQKYLRPRLRAFEDLLAAEGLSPERLALTLQKLEEGRQALQSVAAAAFQDSTVIHEEGYITLTRPKWHSHPRDIRRRMLALALKKFSPDDYPPEHEAMEDLIQAMDRPAFSGRTLHGCEIIPQKDGDFLICREAAAAEKDLPASAGLVWDRRFLLSGTGGESLTIGALREDGLAALRQTLSKEHPALQKIEALPFKVRKTLPTLRHDNNIVFVQCLGYIMPEYAQTLSGPPLTNIMG